MSAHSRTRRGRCPGRTCAGTRAPHRTVASRAPPAAPGHHPRHTQAGLNPGGPRVVGPSTQDQRRRRVRIRYSGILSREHPDRLGVTLVNTALIAGLVGTITGATTTGLFALFTARAQARQQHAIGHSKDLWTARFASFKELWTLTSSFPRYWLELPPKSAILATRESLHVWFFRGGGLLLTNEARERYFDVQDALYHIGKSPKEQLGKEDVERLFRLGEALRVQLCVDLGTTQKARIRTRAIAAPAAPQE